MASLNKIMLIGNLTRDPELRYLPGGAPCAKVGIAVTRTWSDSKGDRQEEVSSFNVTAFDKRAELLAKYAKKGNRMFIEGRLSARTVTNDKGETRTFHDIILGDFQFLSTASADGANSASTAFGAPQNGTPCDAD